MTDDFATIADKVNDLVAHPFADLFPMLPEKELGELAANIVRDGLLDKIIIYGDMILDGRNRYAALKLAGVELGQDHFSFFGGSDGEAASFVESKNVNRRHLTSYERACAVVSFAKMRGMSQKAAAEALGISYGNVQRAGQVKKGPANLRTMVEDGEIGLGVAVAALNTLKPQQVAGFKSADAIKKALVKKGAIGNYFSAYSEHRLVSSLTAILDAMATRDPAALKPWQVELDTAVQQLINVGAKALGAESDEAQVA